MRNFSEVWNKILLSMRR